LSRPNSIWSYVNDDGHCTIRLCETTGPDRRGTEALLSKLLSRELLPDEIARPKRLIEAMRYSSLGGGKRLRPFLVVESPRVRRCARRRAAGRRRARMHPLLSLVHDDLPAMDDSDLRRGRPTLHKAYDDATAILAGDALLTLPSTSSPATRSIARRAPLLLTRALARAAGVGGMAGGQILDLAGEGRFGDREPVDVARLQQMKTGALLHYGCIAGAILGQSSPKEVSGARRFRPRARRSLSDRRRSA